MAQKNLQKLFDKEMNRRQFLAHLGAGALAILGVSGLLKSLLNYGATPHRHVENGYGSSLYAGKSKRS